MSLSSRATSREGSSSLAGILKKINVEKCLGLVADESFPVRSSEEGVGLLVHTQIERKPRGGLATVN